MVQYSDSSGDEREPVKKNDGISVKSRDSSQTIPQMQEFNAKIRFKYRGVNISMTIYYLIKKFNELKWH